MRIVLVVISFLLGQLYLFRCLGKLDRFLESQDELSDRGVLSVALPDAAMEEKLAYLLEAYSIEHPDVDLVLHIDPRVINAVREKRADVGLCPAADVRGGLNCLTLTFPEGIQQQVIWKKENRADEFVQYLWQACRK